MIDHLSYLPVPVLDFTAGSIWFSLEWPAHTI